MPKYSAVAWERAMKIRDVILRAVAKKIPWRQAAEIIGISDRQMRRWKQRYEDNGHDRLFAQRRMKIRLTSWNYRSLLSLSQIAPGFETRAAA